VSPFLKGIRHPVWQIFIFISLLPADMSLKKGNNEKF